MLYNLRTLLALLNSATTSKGLIVEASLDIHNYELKQKPTEEQMKLFEIKYTGPTKDMGKQLSYEINGTMMKDEDIPARERKTVFDTRDMLLAEKAEKARKRKKGKE